MSLCQAEGIPVSGGDDRAYLSKEHRLELREQQPSLEDNLKRKLQQAQQALAQSRAEVEQLRREQRDGGDARNGSTGSATMTATATGPNRGRSERFSSGGGAGASAGTGGTLALHATTGESAKCLNNLARTASMRFLPPWMAANMKNQQQLEEEWSNKLAALRHEKDMEIQELRMKLNSRDIAIANLEQGALLQGQTVGKIQSEMDTCLAKAVDVEDDNVKKSKLIEQQQTRLKENSVTMSTLVRTVKMQSEKISTLQAEVDGLKNKMSERENVASNTYEC